MSGTSSRLRSRRRLVLRSYQFFDDVDRETRRVADRLGITKSDLIRGLVGVGLQELQSETRARWNATFRDRVVEEGTLTPFDSVDDEQV